jgi:hypothetical protein
MVTRLAVLALAVVLTSLLATLTARAQAQPLTGSAEDFERAQFDDPTHIDNRWLPLRPGTQLVYEGSAIVDEEGGIWSDFGVAAQPAFAFVRPDGTHLTVQGTLTDEDLDGYIEDELLSGDAQ